MADLDQVTAQRWIDRWDAQQQGYMPDREERFTALIDAVEAGAGRTDPLLLLDGDHLLDDEGQTPVLARLNGVLTERWEERADADGQEDWKDWWQAATADPTLAGAAAERERRRLSEDHHGSESVRLAEHVGALAAAGFTEIGTVWQHGENRILAAVRAS